jgi:hypothetical protein
MQRSSLTIMSNLLHAYHAGYTVEDIARLSRAGYEFQHDGHLDIWLRYTDAPNGDKTCHLAFYHNHQVCRVSANAMTPYRARSRALRLRTAMLDGRDILARAVLYGFAYEDVQGLLDAGYRYEYGVFIRRERLDSPHLRYRTRMVFLDDANQMRRTWARAETPQKAQRRAYGYIRAMKEHGSLLNAWQHAAAHGQAAA